MTQRLSCSIRSDPAGRCGPITVLSASRNALRFTGLRWTLPTARDHRQVRHSARGEAAELLTSPQGLDPVLIGRGAPLGPCYYRLVDHRQHPKPRRCPRIRALGYIIVRVVRGTVPAGG